jgi:surface antigen
VSEANANSLIKIHKLIASVAILIALASPAHADDDALLGTLGGAALGGFIGNQFGHGAGRMAATGLGAFTGAVIGNSFASSLERENAPSYGRYGYSYYNAAPYYAPAYTYYEPNYVAPPAPPPRIIYVQPSEVVGYRDREPTIVEGAYMEPGYEAPQHYCREFTQTIRIGDEVHESYGTACLQPDGSWRVERE